MSRYTPEYKELVVLLEVSSMVALAVLLNSLVPFKLFWIEGGSITLTALPIAIISLRRGIFAGLFCGFLAGCILLAMPIAVRFHPLQVVLDYPLAFGSLGLVGLFGKSRFNQVIGTTLAFLMRLVSHTLAGVIFFSEYVPIGQSKYLYSLVYNMSYLVPELIITILLLGHISSSHPKLILRYSRS